MDATETATKFRTAWKRTTPLCVHLFQHFSRKVSKCSRPFLPGIQIFLVTSVFSQGVQNKWMWHRIIRHSMQILLYLTSKFCRLCRKDMGNTIYFSTVWWLTSSWHASSGYSAMNFDLASTSLICMVIFLWFTSPFGLVQKNWMWHRFLLHWMYVGNNFSPLYDGQIDVFF